MSFETAANKTQELMKQSGIGALFLHPGVNMYAVTGLMKESYERLLTVVVPDEGKPVAVVPRFEVEAVTKGAKIPIDVRGWNESENPYQLVRRVVGELKRENALIGIDGKMEYSFVYGITNSLPSARFEEATPLLNQLRVIKTDDEIALIRKAALIACKAIGVAFESASPGMTQIEVLDILRAEAKKEDATVHGNASSGVTTSIPHWQSSTRPLKTGDLFLIDIGLRYKWYFGDITRTVAIGEPSPKQKKIYDIVARAQKLACDAVRPGIEAQDLDRIARKVIVDAGYGEQFTHRLGHGLGLDIHEQPYLVEGEKQKWAPGMVHTVEPGIYIPDEFGVRIEDNLAVTSNGSENMSQSALPSDQLLSI